MEPLDPELTHLDKAITEALDFKDEVAKILANRDEGADLPPITDDDDHGDDLDDDSCDYEFADDLHIAIPAHVLGRAAVTVTVVVAKR